MWRITLPRRGAVSSSALERGDDTTAIRALFVWRDEPESSSLSMLLAASKAGWGGGMRTTKRPLRDTEPWLHRYMVTWLHGYMAPWLYGEMVT